MNFTQTLARRAKLCLLLAAGTAALGAQAQEVASAAERGRITLGFEGGTTGFGPVLQYTPSARFNFALSFGYLDFDEKNIKTDRNRFDADMRISNLAATIDWHPWSNGFHFTGGAVAYDHRLDMTARPRNGTVYEIGLHDYTNTEITSLTGRVDTNTRIAPYLGVGWTWTFGRSGFSLTTNFGLMLTRHYVTDLSATGPRANDPVFRTDLAIEEVSINAGSNFFPVAKVGFAYRF